MGLVLKFFEVDRIWKRLVTLAADAVFIISAYFIAFDLRIGSEQLSLWLVKENYYALSITVVVSILAWIRLGLYRAIIRFLDVKVLSTLAIGSIISATVLVVASYAIGAVLPRSIPFIYFTTILVLTAGSRLFVRGLINSRENVSREAVIIYGAGSSGRQLCLSLQHGNEYVPVAFVDNNKHLQGTFLTSIRVFAPDELPNLVERYQIKHVLLAIPSATAKQKKEIIKSVEPLKVRMLTIPGTADLVSGKVSVSQLRDVGIKDLLGREPVPPKEGLLEKCIENKVVLVTGGGGSIGSELCRKIVLLKPSHLIVFEASEYSLYAIEQELNKMAPEISVTPILASVLNSKRVAEVIQQFNVNTIYHAAAYKHVPLVEQNSGIGITNNVMGTKFVVEAAIANNVEFFVLISTDKAVRPTNVMGASKRLAELVVQEVASRSSSTVFSMVRFGNVLGSSGSVVPLFKKQIKDGGPVTVTHPEITRYFMTIPEAASLVIQAGAMAYGGEVFVLDMGKPVKIRDLAENMIKLMGLDVKSETNPDGDIEIQYSGLRPGEKLYEELLIGNDVEGTEHALIMKAKELSLTSEQLETVLNQLERYISDGDMAGVREVLMNASLGFSPVSEVADLLYLQKGKSGKNTQNTKDDKVTSIISRA